MRIRKKELRAARKRRESRWKAEHKGPATTGAAATAAAAPATRPAAARPARAPRKAEG
ncbi:MAG: hypothetical protein V4671_33230 [Armatimonadota bacterium]